MTGRRARRLQCAAAAAALAGAALAAFGPGLRGGFIWDDFGLITDNARLTLDGPGLRWMATTGYFSTWQPLGWLSWAALRAAGGGGAAAFHAASLALHGACAAALFAVLRRLGERAGARRPAFGAFLAALLFCAHPLEASSAVWSTEIPDQAATLFFLWAVFAYLGGGRRRVAAAAALFAASLLFRWKCVTLPLALALLDAWPLRRPLRGPGSRAVWLEKAPFALLAAAAAAANAAAKGAAGYRWAPDAGALARGLWVYLWDLACPLRLAPERLLAGPGESAGAPASLCAALLLLLGALLWLRRRSWPAAAGAAAFFCATAALPLLVPVSGVYRAFPHYGYAACLPLFALAGFGLARLGPRAGTAAASALLALWLPLSRAEARAWGRGTLLWLRTLGEEPLSGTARDNLPDALAREGRFHDAWFFARAAATQMPWDAVAARNLAGIERATPGLKPDPPLLWAHLAPDELALGRVDDALALAGKALARRPGLPEAHEAMALALEARGEKARAAAHRDAAQRGAAGKIAR